MLLVYDLSDSAELGVAPELAGATLDRIDDQLSRRTFAIPPSVLRREYFGLQITVNSSLFGFHE